MSKLRSSSSSGGSGDGSSLRSMNSNSGASMYLPKVLATRKVLNVKSTDLHFSKLSDGCASYKYTVQWEEDLQESAAVVAIALTNVAASHQQQQQKQQQSSQKQAQKSDSFYLEEMLKHDRMEECSDMTPLDRIPSCKKGAVVNVAAAGDVTKKQKKLGGGVIHATESQTKPAAPKGSVCCLQLLRRCDGPCGKMRDPHNLEIFGRCEHAICKKCLKDGEKVPADLGGSGCPNAQCYLFDKTSKLQNFRDRKKMIRKKLLNISSTTDESS